MPTKPKTDKKPKTKPAGKSRDRIDWVVVRDEYVQGYEADDGRFRSEPSYAELAARHGIQVRTVERAAVRVTKHSPLTWPEQRLAYAARTQAARDEIRSRELATFIAGVEATSLTNLQQFVALTGQALRDLAAANEPAVLYATELNALAQVQERALKVLHQMIGEQPGEATPAAVEYVANLVEGTVARLAGQGITTLDATTLRQAVGETARTITEAARNADQKPPALRVVK